MRGSKALIFASLLIFAVGVAAGFLLRANVYERHTSLEINVGLYSIHIQVFVERADGTVELIKDGVATNNAAVLTNIGKDWIENQLGDSPSSNPAKWISLSTSSSTPSASWTSIPDEITTGGLQRAAGTYQSTGVGQWTISNQFTATASFTGVRLMGLHFAGSGDNNLLAADTFSPVNLESGDKLTVICSISVS